jgi:protein-tyrosine phosphatase
MPVTIEGGLANLRDVGGLHVDGGGVVRRGVLYRSDAPLSGEPDPDLAPWPPSCVIDLRSPEELLAEHPLELRGAVVHYVPLMSRAAPSELAAEPGGLTLLGLYASMVADGAELVAQVAELIATEPGPCLVHCAVGKDRTGVIVAIVLSAVGVSRAEIVADYERTGPNMPAVLDRIVNVRPAAEQAAFRAGLEEFPAHLFATHTGAIDAVLDIVTGYDGGAAGWLLAHGLPAERLALLRERLVNTSGD